MNLDYHPCFTRQEDPSTGVLSYVLTEHVSPLQKVLYYISPSIRGEGRYLWFRSCFPPSKIRLLAVVDLWSKSKDIRYFPDTAVIGGPTSECTPLIHPSGEAAYVGVEDGIYLKSVDGSTREIGRMPKTLIQNRHLFRLATDITQSCDGRWLLLDSRIGNRWLISLMDAESGEVKPLRWFIQDHTHVAFSLHDPTLMQLNQGHGIDPISGDRYEMNVRMWLMDTNLTRYEPVDGGMWFGHPDRNCHEWWTASGKIQWCDYEKGIFEIDPATREKSLVWPHPLVHGQCDASERYLCGDQNPYNWNDKLPCSVWFFDRQTQREVAIVSRMPEQPLPWQDFRDYHIDPHPHFSEDGERIIYTTIYAGKVTVALCPTAPLRRLLA